MTEDAPAGRIHSDHPFAPAAAERSPARRFRSRLASGVTLWTTTGAPRPSGLTVTSVMVGDGEPPRLAGVIDPDSDFFEALGDCGVFAVSLLTPADRILAEQFAGLMPAPGGPFAAGQWTTTPFGPVPAHVTTWAGVRFEESSPFGWGRLVQGRIDSGAVGSADALVHHHGRYFDLP